MSMISILCPTRDRIVERDRFLKSINDTISYPQNIEILFAVDKDDVKTRQILPETIKKYHNLNIKYFIRNRSLFLQRDYYDWLCGMADGDFYWMLGDDVVFLVPNWDVIINRKIAEILSLIPDRIMCLSIADNTPKPKETLPPFPCYPLVSKEAVNVLGFIAPPEIPNWGADYAIYQIYQPIGRLYTLNDRIYLNHISSHTKQVKDDNVAKRVGDIFNTLKMLPQYNIDRIVKDRIPLYRNQLVAYINKRWKL